MGRPAGWMRELTGRSPMKSPGAPSLRREVERKFWGEIAKGLTSENAATAVGVSQAAGSRWFRERGGMPRFMLAPVTGRYLSFTEREEIAVLASALLPKYGVAVDRETAHEMLSKKMDAAAAHEAAAQQAQDAAKAQAEYDKMQREFGKQQKASRPKAAPAPRAKKETNPVTDFLGSSQGQSIVRSVVSGIFGTLKRR